MVTQNITFCFEIINFILLYDSSLGFTSTSTNHITHGDVRKNDYITYYFRGDQLVGAASPNKYRDLAIVREALY